MDYRRFTLHNETQFQNEVVSAFGVTQKTLDGSSFEKEEFVALSIAINLMISVRDKHPERLLNCIEHVLIKGGWRNVFLSSDEVKTLRSNRFNIFKLASLSCVEPGDQDYFQSLLKSKSNWPGENVKYFANEKCPGILAIARKNIFATRTNERIYFDLMASQANSEFMHLIAYSENIRTKSKDYSSEIFDVSGEKAGFVRSSSRYSMCADGYGTLFSAKFCPDDKLFEGNLPDPAFTVLFETENYQRSVM